LSAALLDRAEASHARPPRVPASGVPFYTVLSTDQPTIVGFRRALRAAPVPSSKNLPSGGQSVGYDDARRLGILPPDAIAALAYVLAETPSGVVLHVPVYEEVTRACGDNLVAVHSGVLEGASMLYVRGVAHGGYTDDPHVQSLIDRILRGVRPAGAPAPACLGGGGSLPQATGEGTTIVAAGTSTTRKAATPACERTTPPKRASPARRSTRTAERSRSGCRAPIRPCGSSWKD
jgi:hypothetical protein